MSGGAAAIEVSGLVKRYGTNTAVDGVTFRVEPGEVYGLLGENGAGKSTTVEILEGNRTPTEGSARVLGTDPQAAGREWRDRIGVVLQSSGFESTLSVGELLRLYATSYRNPRPVEECLELVGLTASAAKRAGALSGGQRRRLDLAAGIIGRPEVLFLDEPTTGFDPSARRSSWQLIRALCEGGTTVLLTSHYLDEVEHLAARVGVLVRGRLVAEGTPAELTASLGATVIRFGVAPNPGSLFTVGHGIEAIVAALRAAGHAPNVRADGVVEITAVDATRAVHLVSSWAIETDVELTGLSVNRPSLEDLFLNLHDADATSESGSGPAR